MSDNTYNGWTNYETWRLNLEWFDGMDCRDWGGITTGALSISDVYDIAQAMKDHVEDSIRSQYDMVADSRVVDYALAFVGEVNWREIADHMIDAYASATEES